MIAACVRKEWHDHRSTLRQGAVILALVAGVSTFGWSLLDGHPTPDSRTAGQTSIVLALSVVIWFAGIVSMVLSPDGERCGTGFLERQPAGMARLFAGKLVFVALSLPLLWLCAIGCSGIATLIHGDPLDAWLHCCTGTLPSLTPLLVLAAGTLAFGPLVQRGVLAVAGGPILLVPLFFIWNAHQLPVSLLMRYQFAQAGLLLAGLATAIAGFVFGRRLLAPPTRPVRLAACTAVVAHGLALLPFAQIAAHITEVDPDSMLIHAGSVGEGGITRLELSGFESPLHLRATLDPKGRTLQVEPRPAPVYKGPPRTRPSLRERLDVRNRRTIGVDNLCRTIDGRRFWTEQDVLCVEAEDGSITRIECGYDDRIAVRGDALLLRHQGLSLGNRERCRIVDLHHRRAFTTPIVDPDGFIASGGQWWIADVDLKLRMPLVPRSWRRVDPLTGETTICSALRDGDLVLSVQRGGRFVVKTKAGVELVDPWSGDRQLLTRDEVSLPRGDAPSCLADGTQLFAIQSGDHDEIAALAPGAHTFGPRVALGLLIGALHDDVVLATTPDRRRLLHVHLTDGRIETLAVRIEEDR